MTTTVTARALVWWDETFPGFVSTAFVIVADITAGTSERYDGASLGDRSNRDAPPGPSPLTTLRDAVDKAARAANVHPARIGEITVTIKASDLFDVIPNNPRGA